MPDTASINITPTPSGTFSSTNINLAISTNNNTGYALYFSTADQDNHMHSQNPSNTETIAPVTNSVTEANFPNNSWGYSLSETAPTDTTTYQAIPTNSDIALKTTSAASSDNYNLTFGAKVDTTIPSGTYTNTVTVSAVANPPLITDMGSLTYMQDMTPEVCGETEVGTTTRLTDKRDNKQYWVTKLADNNCWMTQNLDLDLSTSKALTPDDSDVSSNWTPTVSTTTTIFNSSSNTGQYSWDPGMYVKSDPDGYSKYCNNVSSLSNSSCTSAGWTDVSNMTPMSDGAINTAISGNTYNAHYLVGNYYQWNAATAGGSTADSSATSSICPKGWRLPANTTTPREFQSLMITYDIDINNNSTSSGSSKITRYPLYFHPSGDIDSGSLRNAGGTGVYWSSTAYSDVTYSLYFNSNYIYPTNDIYRYFGQSVRCLARQ